MSLYVTLGVFLIMAARNPSANRSLIAFTAWSSFAHAVLMAGQAFANFIARGELIVDEHSIRGLALAAVAGHCVAIVKMPVLEKLIPNQSVLALTART